MSDVSMPPSQVGRFVDVEGLGYKSVDHTSTINSDGTFSYHQNAEVSFYIGDLKLGASRGKEFMSFLDLVEGAADISNSRLINRARLLFTLGNGLGFERKILITKEVNEAVSRHASNIDLDVADPSVLDHVLGKLASELNTNVKTIAHTRNHIRRAIAGFKVLRDLKVPVKDDNFVYVDVYLPLIPKGKYPVLVSSTTYGKRITYSGPRLDDPNDVAEFERAEDQWHTTPPDFDLKVPNTGPWVGKWSKQRRYETIGSFNTFLWVPRGYAMVKMDPRGVGQSPGTRGIPGQESSDVFHVVEWAAEQPWSTGSTCLAGNSYGANTQWPVVLMKPKGLKCFIPYATDTDRYREVSYIGGVPTFAYLSQWFAGVRALSYRWSDTGDIVEHMKANQFYDQNWQRLEPKVENIDIPVLLAASQVSLVHGRCPYELWNRIGSKHKHMQIVDGNYYSWPNHEVASKLIDFADLYLKNIKRDLETLGLQMRLGHKKWYWRVEPDWPVAGIRYIQWHLNSDGTLGEKRLDTGARCFSYPAEAKCVQPRAGVSFISASLDEDMEFAGHFAAKINVSSTAHDADVVILIWALDETGKIVSFCMQDHNEPLNQGLLRVSHRKLDPDKTLPWRPYHLHTKEAYAPLHAGEVVEAEIEMFPATARLKKGWRIRVDICPSEEQPNVERYQPRPLRVWNPEFHDNHTYTLHTGGDLQNYLLLPLVPLRDLEKQSMLTSLEY